jgi:cytochrome d ubiquinol oxidase subunit I
MVALGTLFSAFWILSANSWMQTPAGYEIIDGTFHVTSWIEAIFNPSFPYRFMHMVTACYLTTAFVVIGISAHYLLKRRFVPEAKTMMWMGIGLIACLAPAQIVLGDLHGLNTFAHQPAKIAAMEGHWEAKEGAPMIVFGIPDVEAEKNHWEVSIPLLGSLILTHEIRGAVPGLKDWAPGDRPYVPLVFASFRVMVSIGLLMVFVAICGVVLRLRGTLFERRWFLRLCVACTPIGFIAVIAGWITTESGRQPWVVYDLMRTAEGISPAITTSSVMTSLGTFFVAYAIIFSAGTYYILILIRRGPTPDVPEDTARPLRTPQRPLSAADQRIPSGRAGE